jgi:hypothetical protein
MLHGSKTLLSVRRRNKLNEVGFRKMCTWAAEVANH